MSISISRSFSGGTESVERLAVAASQVEMSSGGGGAVAQDTSPAVPVSITNVDDLKRAELRGEVYSISDEQLIKAIEKAIRAVEGKTTTLEFSIHEKTKLIAVKVLDKSTGEIIREIPPEKSLDFVAKLWEMAGLIIDERR